jgi:hypothetical protein
MIAARRHNRSLTAQMIAAAALMLVVASLALPSIAHAEPCPNEAIRLEQGTTGLPECRAYEMVTPPFKNGPPPLARVQGTTIVSADGSRLAYDALGAFGGAEDSSNEAGAMYIASRLGGGWASTPVTPSASEFFGGNSIVETGLTSETIDFEPGLSRTLIATAPRSGKRIDGRFYIRGEAGGYEEIGPIFPAGTVSEYTAEAGEFTAPAYRGASVTFSHIFFDDKNEGGLDFLFPGDDSAPGKRSLYEYSGTHQEEPELVAVKNDETLASAAAREGKAHINEAAEQIGQCGALLGGASTEVNHPLDSYNAISPSGDTVFFTVYGEDAGAPCEVGAAEPVVDEVYARLDRSHTVDISEPTTGPSGDCELCDTSDPKKALFQGASEDGSRAYFITEQALIDGPGGLEPTGMNLYEYDFDGPAHRKVNLIAPSLSTASGPWGGVARIAENGSAVYFVSEAVLPGAAVNPLGHSPTDGAPNLYLYAPSTGALTFVAMLSPNDSQDWSPIDYRPVEATPDGRFLLFASAAALTPDASGEGNQLYRYEVPSPGRPDGGLVRVSVGAEGLNRNGNDLSTEFPFAPEYTDLAREFGQIQQAFAKSATVPISDDGQTVVFESPVALTSGALNEQCAFEAFDACFAGAENVYEWHEGVVSLISDGRDTHSIFDSSATRSLGLTPSGATIFFSTADSLLRQDTDTQLDVYAATTDGGFAEPPSSSACVGDVCQPPPSTPPVLDVPESATFSGPGNLVPPLRAPAKPIKKAAAQTRAEKLAKALAVCKKESRKKRARCEKQAKKRYGKGK